MKEKRKTILITKCSGDWGALDYLFLVNKKFEVIEEFNNTHYVIKYNNLNYYIKKEDASIQSNQ